MTRLLLPLSLILLFSCKGKEKHYEIDMITNSGSTQSGHIFHQGIKLSPEGYTARYQFIWPNQGKWDTTIFYFIERDGKAKPPDQFFPKSELDDTLGYIHRNDSLKFFIDSSSFGPVTYGFKRVHHKKKQYWNGQEITHAQDSGWTIGDADFKITPSGTAIASSPYFQVTGQGLTHIADSTGTVATRDSSGHWDIKDPARALEVMYKIVNHKNR